MTKLISWAQQDRSIIVSQQQRLVRPPPPLQYDTLKLHYESSPPPVIQVPRPRVSVQNNKVRKSVISINPNAINNQLQQGNVPQVKKIFSF
jgi:hypothetical protein